MTEIHERANLMNFGACISMNAFEGRTSLFAAFRYSNSAIQVTVERLFKMTSFCCRMKVSSSSSSVFVFP